MSVIQKVSHTERQSTALWAAKTPAGKTDKAPPGGGRATLVNMDEMLKLLGRPVRVARPVCAFAFCGGWGDGWYLNSPGALFRLRDLDEKAPEIVRFWGGPEPVDPGAPEGSRSEGFVSVDDLECLADLSPIIDRIEGVFGEQAKAWRWIQAPCGALGGQPPRHLLGNEQGHLEIEAVLARIEDEIHP